MGFASALTKILVLPIHAHCDPIGGVLVKVQFDPLAIMLWSLFLVPFSFSEVAKCLVRFSWLLESNVTNVADMHAVTSDRLGLIHGISSRH